MNCKKSVYNKYFMYLYLRTQNIEMLLQLPVEKYKVYYMIFKKPVESRC